MDVPSARRGRKKLPQESKRDKHLHVKFNTVEYSRLEEQASKNHLSMSEYVRQLVFEKSLVLN